MLILSKAIVVVMMATGTVAQGQLRSPSDKNERELHGYYSHVEGKRSHVEGKRSYHHPRDGPVQGKLIGGGEAEPGEYPYYADMQICNNGMCGMCGGSLIAPQVVLTAAHCIIGSDGTRQTYAGQTIDIGGMSRGADGQRVKCVADVAHPQYSSSNFKNDIALVKLEKPICTVGPKLRLTEDTSFPAVGADVTAMGLGNSWQNNVVGSTLVTDPNLSDLVLQIQSTSDCQGFWQSVDNTQVCTVTPREGADVCRGDSGGPLVSIAGNVHTQVGLVSYGEACTATMDKPGVWTRVATYMPWIKDEVCNKWGLQADFCPGGVSQTCEKCTDKAGWVEQINGSTTYTCGSYAANGWCADYGSNSYGADGTTPNESCCACGGGVISYVSWNGA